VIQWSKTVARILVVDDDPAVGGAIVDWLLAAGHCVCTTTNATRSEALIDDFNPDLLVLDILMPERDGSEVTLSVRRLYPAIKIIAMSGGGRRRELGLLTVAEKLGANASLCKPFLPETLCRTIGAILGAPEAQLEPSIS
jgi:DNA-binding response OmpR family regulator